MKTSVIITVYNRPKMLTACLRALALSTVRIDEAVVSDDGSDESNVQLMRKAIDECKFPVRYVRQEHNGYRLAAARNNAIRAATGDYLVSIDGDILLLPETIQAHLRHAKPGLFLAGNRALLDESSTGQALAQNVGGAPLGSLPCRSSSGYEGQEPRGIFAEPSEARSEISDQAKDAMLSGHNPAVCSSLNYRAKEGERFLEALWDKAGKDHLAKMQFRFQRNYFLRKLGLAPAHKPKILGCHFSLFRDDAERVNGFDEKFTGWGLEDDDFARRLYKAGMRGRSVILEARALHLWHPAVGSKPQSISTSPNMAYFKRENVPAYCVEGLKK